jgi:hypothetical protein
MTRDGPDGTSSANALELMPPMSTDPFEHVRTFFRSGFCEPSHAESQPALPEESAGDESSLVPETISTFSRGLESIIQVHPFENLKKALQYGFCDPLEVAKPYSGFSLMTRSYDSEESSRLSTHEASVVEDEQVEDSGVTGIIFTHSGTSRAPRILRALEMFFFTIFFVAATLYLLRHLDLHFNLELHSKVAGDYKSSFISFHPKVTGADVSPSFICFS